MELLLLLSALLTGLTGAMSGERRTEAAHVQQSAVATLEIIVEAAAEAVAPARHALVAVPSRPIASLTAASPAWRPRSVDVVQDLRRVTAKRLE